MHASSQHTKAQLMIERAKELIADTDVFLKKSRSDHDAMQKKIALQEQEHKDAHKKLDGTIRTELNKLEKIADEYFGSLDDA